MLRKALIPLLFHLGACYASLEHDYEKLLSDEMIRVENTCDDLKIKYGQEFCDQDITYMFYSGIYIGLHTALTEHKHMFFPEEEEFFPWKKTK